MGFGGHIAEQQYSGLNVRFGSKADIVRCQADVCFTPNSGHWNSVAKCPLCAKSGLLHRSENNRALRFRDGLAAAQLHGLQWRGH